MREHTTAKNLLLGRVCHTCAHNRTHGPYPRRCNDTYVPTEKLGEYEELVINENDSCDNWHVRHSRENIDIW